MTKYKPFHVRPDGTVYSPTMDLHFESEAKADAFLAQLECAAKRPLDYMDFHNHGGGYGLTNRPKTRDQFERHADKVFRESQYPRQAEISNEERVARGFEERWREQQLADMKPKERSAFLARQRADEAARQQAATTAHEEFLRRPHVAEALAKAKRAAILAAFDADLTDREVEFAQHNFDLLKSTLNVGQFNTNYKSWSEPIHARKAASLADFQKRLAEDTARAQQELAQYAPLKPLASDTPNKPFAWDKPAEKAESTSGRPMVRVFHDGGSTVIPGWFYDANVSDPELIADTARRNGSVDDAALTDTDAPAGTWS